MNSLTKIIEMFAGKRLILFSLFGTLAQLV